jgi:hypothetical protein
MTASFAPLQACPEIMRERGVEVNRLVRNRVIQDYHRRPERISPGYGFIEMSVDRFQRIRSAWHSSLHTLPH